MIHTYLITFLPLPILLRSKIVFWKENRPGCISDTNLFFSATTVWVTWTARMDANISIRTATLLPVEGEDFTHLPMELGDFICRHPRNHRRPRRPPRTAWTTMDWTASTDSFRWGFVLTSNHAIQTRQPLETVRSKSKKSITVCEKNPQDIRKNSRILDAQRTGRCTSLRGQKIVWRK